MGEYGIIAVVAIIFVILRRYMRERNEKAKQNSKDEEGYRINHRGGTLIDNDRLSNFGRSEDTNGRSMRSRDENES